MLMLVTNPSQVDGKWVWSVWRCCHPVATVEMACLRVGKLGMTLGLEESCGALEIPENAQ